MRHQKELFMARKKELRIILKDFESTFMGLHGRYAMPILFHMLAGYTLYSPIHVVMTEV